MILLGRSEKNRTAAKKTVVKMACTSTVEPSLTMGAMPTVKEVAAQRGMANRGPMVR